MMASFCIETSSANAEPSEKPGSEERKACGVLADDTEVRSRAWHGGAVQ